MYEAAASRKDIAQAPVTNWKPQYVTLAGYSYAVRHGMKFQLVTPYRVSHLQRYSVTVRGNNIVCTHLYIFKNTIELHLSGHWLSGSAWPFRSIR